MKLSRFTRVTSVVAGFTYRVYPIALHRNGMVVIVAVPPNLAFLNNSVAAGSLLFPVANLRPVAVICSGYSGLSPVPYPACTPPFLSPILGAAPPPIPESEQTPGTWAC